MVERVRSFDERKLGRVPRKKGFAENAKAAKKTAKAQKSWTARMQADLTDALKQVKTQQQLTNIEEMVNTYGTAEQRNAYNQLQSTFKKEARMLIDMELETMKSKEQLESIRSMVEQNGSAAQKERFAQYESYYKKPTWEKYAKLHGTDYSAPVSGVAEADRRAEQIINANNLKKAAEEAKKADEAARQVEKGLKASSEMDEFLREGDKLIEEGKKINPEQGSKPTPTSEPGVKSTSESGSRPTPESGPRPTSESGSRPTPESGSRPTSGSGPRPTSEPNVKPSKLMKFFKKGVKFAIGAAIVAGIVYLGSKLFGGSDDKNNTQQVSNQPIIPTPVVEQDSTEQDSTARIISVPVDTTKVDSLVTDTTKTDSARIVLSQPADSLQVDSTQTDTTRIDSTRIILPLPVDSTLTDSARVANTDSLSRITNPIVETAGDKPAIDGQTEADETQDMTYDDSGFYIVKKGDCVWKLVEKRLERNKAEYELIKEFLTGVYGHTPSHNAIIRHATILTCEENGIKYIIDDQKLMPKRKLNIPKRFDVKNKFDTAA